MGETFWIDQQELDIYTPKGFEVLADLWTKSAWQQRLSYETVWAGIPVIQTPEDLLMMQELIWKLRPDVIVETGTAHGGSAIFYASILELIGKGQVISVDVEIRKYNRLAIQAHPFSKRITLVEGSSTDAAIYFEQIMKRIGSRDVVLVALDSNHAYSHVSDELRIYSKLVTEESYLVVFDTILGSLQQAPDALKWLNDNPTAAVKDFLREHPEFEADPYYNRLRSTYCPGGFLKRI